MELLTFMEPLCASMIWRVMASPRPVPSGLKVLKGVKSLAVVPEKSHIRCLLQK